MLYKLKNRFKPEDCDVRIELSIPKEVKAAFVAQSKRQGTTLTKLLRNILAREYELHFEEDFPIENGNSN